MVENWVVMMVGYLDVKSVDMKVEWKVVPLADWTVGNLVVLMVAR